MACTKETVKSNGLNIWSNEAAPGRAPLVDIIAVQGLGADPFYTWVKKAPTSSVKGEKGVRDRVRFWKGKNLRGKGAEDESTETMWVRDLLVPLFENARIATYSYESDWRDPDVKTSLRQCAEQFLNVLSQHRHHSNERKRPIILIGHSLGSLVIQQALVIAVHQQDFTDLRHSVAGIIFLGAPFQGSDASVFGKRLARISRRDSTLLELLERNSPSLYELSRDFWGSYKDRDLVCFYENKETDYRLLKTQVVSAQSASLHGKRMIHLNTDHSGLNKFSGENDENYSLVLPELRRMIEGAESTVSNLHHDKGKHIDVRRDGETQLLSIQDTSTTTHGNVHWMVPGTSNELFTGRAELLLRIQTALRINHDVPEDKQKRFVVTGLGGMGKSEICLKLANLMREKFWGVFWVDVSKPSTAERDFVAVAELLGRSVKSIRDALQVLSNTKQTWLLILDNADDQDFNYQDYLPSGTQGVVIITSRVYECRKYSPDESEALEGLDDLHSKELLLKAAGIPQESWLSHDSQAEEVVRLLGSHTLALIQAGAYISNGHCQLHEYPQVYRRHGKRLLKYQLNQAQSRYCNVYATFEASADVLKQSKSEAAKDALYLLEILSMLDFSFLPLKIFEDAWHGSRRVLGSNHENADNIETISPSHVSKLPSFMAVNSDEWDPFNLVEAVSLLASLSLVSRHDLDGFPGISMHPLTHAWAKERQGPEKQGVAWVAAGCVLILSRHGSTIWRAQERLLVPHIQSYLDIKISWAFSFGSKAIVVPILSKCGWALLDMRQDSRLRYLLDHMFIELELNPKTPSEEYLLLSDLEAMSLLNLGRREQSVALLKQTDNIREATLAKEHPSRLASQHRLGFAYQENRQVNEAVIILEQVVNIEKTTLPKEHPSRLASQHELARAYKANRQVKEAVAILEQVVNIREATLPKEHPSRLASQHELAVAYQANGQIKEAVAILEQVVNIQDTTLAKEHPNRLASQHTLAVAYRANRQVKEAVAILEQVVNIQDTTLAKEHPDRLASQHTLAVAYRANRQVKEAVPILEQVVNIKTTTLAKEHPSRLVSERALAVVYAEDGRVSEAVEIMERVVEIQKTTLTEDDPSRVAAERLRLLANVYAENGQVNEAVGIMERVVEI